jgi:beta-glucanase (GH16 family)
MLLHFLIFGASLVGISCHAQSSQPAARLALSPADTTWKLVWADEFNTPGAPDPKNWQFETGFARNHEDQWYQADNARCAEGLLTIEARREQKPNPTYRATGNDWRTQRKTIEYTSSSLNTNGLHQWQYGRFEMRGRIDVSPGMWPAFWTLGVAGEWPSNGEIDIMEYYRNDLLANVAWGTNQRYKAEWRTTKKPIASFTDPTWASKFHVWRMDWDETGIRLYVDDQLLNSVSLRETVNQNGTNTNPFKQPHYVLLNLALGGDNGGDPGKTTFPRRFDIDYVRVYQR